MDAKERLKAVHNARADFLHTVPQAGRDIFNAVTDACDNVLADIDRARNHIFCTIPHTADHVSHALADVGNGVFDGVKGIINAIAEPVTLVIGSHQTHAQCAHASDCNANRPARRGKSGQRSAQTAEGCTSRSYRAGECRSDRASHTSCAGCQRTQTAADCCTDRTDARADGRYQTRQPAAYGGCDAAEGRTHRPGNAG